MFTVTGVSRVDTAAPATPQAVVEGTGVLLTTSTLATTRSPVSLTLQLVRTDAGWRVALVHGEGS